MCNTITLSWPLFTLSSSATQFLPPTVTWPRKLRHLLPRSAATFSFAAGEKGLGPQVRGNDAKRGPTAQRPTFACHYGKQKNCEKNLHKSKQCNSGVLIGAGDIATLHTDQDILLTLKEGRGEGGLQFNWRQCTTQHRAFMTLNEWTQKCDCHLSTHSLQLLPSLQPFDVHFGCYPASTSHYFLTALLVVCTHWK